MDTSNFCNFVSNTFIFILEQNPQIKPQVVVTNNFHDSLILIAVFEHQLRFAVENVLSVFSLFC